MEPFATTDNKTAIRLQQHHCLPQHRTYICNQN
jgi:hypothetical protein